MWKINIYSSIIGTYTIDFKLIKCSLESSLIILDQIQLIQTMARGVNELARWVERTLIKLNYQYFLYLAGIMMVLNVAHYVRVEDWRI